MRRAAAVSIVAAVSLVVGACTTPAPAPTATSATSSATVPAPTPTPTPTVSPAPDGFVLLSDVDSSILQDIRYATPHNFVGRPIAGYDAGVCILTRVAAQALARVQRAAVAEGYSLKVYDCYRPTRAVQDFAAWGSTADETMRDEFYPDLTKPQLFAQGFIGGANSTHSSGSTMDLTLVRLPAATQPTFAPGQALTPCTAPVGSRFPDNSIDMGTGFDCFDPRSHTLSPDVGDPASTNRLRLRRLMSAQGFANYSNEWWHYDLTGDPFHGQFFDFPVDPAAVPD